MRNYGQATMQFDYDQTKGEPLYTWYRYWY